MLGQYQPGGLYGDAYQKAVTRAKRANPKSRQLNRLSFQEFFVYFGHIPVSRIKIEVDRRTITVAGTIGEFEFRCWNWDFIFGEVSTYYLDYDSEKEFIIARECDEFDTGTVKRTSCATTTDV